MVNKTDSSEEMGWIVNFARTVPRYIKDLPPGRGPGQIGPALDAHFKECFARLEAIAESGIEVKSRMYNIGCMVLVGPEAACLRLKRRVEKDFSAL